MLKQQGKLLQRKKLNETIFNVAKTASFVMVLSYTIVISFPSTPFSILNMKTTNYYVFATIPEKQEEQAVKNNLSLSNLLQQGSPYLGNPSSAPITIIDFSDFQCYLCARYVKATEPLINQTYIQTDKVVLVFKHLPNRGFDSMNPAIAPQCTNDQGSFWDFHQLLYKNQKPIDSGWVSKENLKKFAAKIAELDMDKFNSCFDNQKYKSFVEKDVALASSLGFQETPSFVIVNSKDGSDPEVLSGAHPFASFKAIIDKKLTENSPNKGEPSVAERYLLIDEFNRANMNRAFGEMFLAIEYGKITLRPAERITYGKDVIEIPQNFRMICTMNDFDKNLLLTELSYGLISRFAFVSITAMVPL